MKKLMLLTIAMLMLTAPVTLGAMASVPGSGGISANQVVAGDVIKVGFLSPETGGLSQYSGPFVNAAMLAGQHLNDTTDYDWVITVYDTQTSEDGATAAMTAALNDESVYVAGAAGSSNTLAAAALAKTNQVPLISYASTSPDLTTFADDGYLWRVVPSDAFQGQADADIALEGGFETATIVHLDNAYGIGIADKFESAFEAGGGEVLSKLSYAEEKTDFSSEISQIQSDNPDVIFVVSYATDGSNLFVQMGEQGITKPVIGTDGIADNGIFDEQTGTQEAMINVVATKPTSPDSTAVTDFNTAYDAAFPGETGIFTAEAYDSVMAGAKAVMAANSTAGADIKTALAALDYAGASGQVKFDSNGDVLGAIYEVLEVRDGAAGFTSVGNWNAGTLTLDTGFEQKAIPEITADDGPFSFFGVFLAFASFAVITVIRKRKN